ncbi:unnamed protein product [Phytophthora fragariaefolia]|uniref:Unnamed protein product n=1 Tax=Phytophthora fragariaefolia TaxID=1490495 RepID=A0A9W6XJG0_9STRA|nr:unnamed protein product [Phytophthora fragariaefolia]
MADRTRQAVFGSADTQHHGVGSVRKRRLPVSAERPAGRLCSALRKETHSPPPLKEQVPETPLLCPSVVTARSNLVVVTASVKWYQEPMMFLNDSGASLNFATKASVAGNIALYARALEASHGNTGVSVRLLTGSIVSTRKVVLRLKVKFDDFDSVEPFIVLDMDDRYDLILGMPWLAKHEPWIDWCSRTIDGFVREHRLPRGEQHIVGTSEVLTTPSASPPRALELGEDEKQDSQTQVPLPWGYRVLQPSCTCGAAYSQGAGAVRERVGRGGSVQAPPKQVILAGSAHGNDGAGVGTRAEEGGRAGATIMQCVGSESAHADKSAAAGSAQAEGRAGVGARADNSGRVGDPLRKA